MIDKKNINALRFLGTAAVNKANSGHPGIVLDAAPMAYILFKKFMNFDPTMPKWINRDRFILSAGHGSALLYSLLHLFEYDIKIEDLKKFRQLESITPGHPEFGLTPGVEATTGPLGQGIAMAVGCALAETHLASIYNTNDFKLIDHFTYVICGDGDLQEGVSSEAISFAGKNQLNKLIILHDSNDVQLDSFVENVCTTNYCDLFKAYNWNVIKVDDGENIKEIEEAIMEAKKSLKPTYIEVKTIIGIGATKQGTPAVHGEPLKDDLQKTKINLDWKYNDFEIPNDVKESYHEIVGQKIHKRTLWDIQLAKYEKKYPELAKKMMMSISTEVEIDEVLFSKNIAKNDEATRISSGNIFDKISEISPQIIGGSADLSASTKIKGADGVYSKSNPKGRNILYGVREFAMASINNGIALHGGLIPVASGFLVFSDYLKPALRLGALMGIHTIYVFTHDSVAVGEDGPTHQPIEQLAMIRSIPNVNLFRPCDYQETYASYLISLKIGNKPSVIIATRQNLPQLHHENVLDNVAKGGYVIKEQKNAQITIVATGSEVSLALETKNILDKKGKLTKVVSMPCTQIFDLQNKEYRDGVLDKNTTIISLELASTFGWDKYTNSGFSIGIDKFGLSAPIKDVYDVLGFTPEKVAEKIMNFLK